MLSFIREGDVLYIESISRSARNTRDFLELMDTFKSKGVGVICFKEPIDTTTPAGRMMATVFASMYEMERENIMQRQREGIDVAKQRGVKFDFTPVFIIHYNKQFPKLVSCKGGFTVPYYTLWGMVKMNRIDEIINYNDKDCKINAFLDVLADILQNTSLNEGASQKCEVPFVF